MSQQASAAKARWAKAANPETLPDEEWRCVPSFPGYEASSLGRVRSKHKVLSSYPNRTGHRFVSPSIDGKQAPAAVHRMVCEAFHGRCPDGYECGHADGNSENNRPENLAWITRLQNQRDRIRHGTTNRGQRNGRAKLTNEQIEEVRLRAKRGEAQQDLAAEFGITQSHVSNIKNGARCRKV